MEKANASVEADKTHILNVIAGRGLDDPPLETHPECAGGPSTNVLPPRCRFLKPGLMG